MTRMAMLFLLLVTLARSETPVRVFILAGQSNMQGKGSVDHLEQLWQQNPEKYAYLGNETQWYEREDVYIRFHDEHGKLEVGYGTPLEKRFGPELGFGHVVGDFYPDETILIIKCAWGGASMAVEFRPPLSCMDGVDYCTRGQQECSHCGGEGCKPIVPLKYGEAYYETIAMIQETLKNIKKYIPTFEKGSRVTVEGFLWFQGWNDFFVPQKRGEYGENLANFIRSVRLDLDDPNLPFLVGELGQTPINSQKKIMELFREIQASVTEMNEFRNNTVFVETHPFFVEKNQLGDDKFDGEYHYYGRADTFLNIGRSFGEAMLRLMGEDVGNVENEER